MGSLFAALNAADGKLGAPCESRPEMNASFRLVNRRAKRSDSGYPPDPQSHQKLSTAVPIPRSNSVLDEERARIASTLKMTPVSTGQGPGGSQSVALACGGNASLDNLPLQTEPQPVPNPQSPGHSDSVHNSGSPDIEPPCGLLYPQINTSIWRTMDPFADAAAKPCYRHLSQEMEAIQYITGRTPSLTQLLEINEATGIRCAPAPLRRRDSGSVMSDEPYVSYSTVEEWVDGVESAMMDDESEDEDGGVSIVEEVLAVGFQRRRAGGAAKFFLGDAWEDEDGDNGSESDESRD